MKELGFDQSRETFLSTMIKVHETMSEKLSRGTFKVLENGKLIDMEQVLGTEAPSKYHSIAEYQWQFTNTQLKLVRVWAFVCNPLTNLDGMITFIYHSHSSPSSNSALKDCVLSSVAK